MTPSVQRSDKTVPAMLVTNPISGSASFAVTAEQKLSYSVVNCTSLSAVTAMLQLTNTVVCIAML